MESQSRSITNKRSVGFTSAVKDNGLHAIQNASNANTIDVNVGFLKVHHRYSMEFTLPNDIGFTESVCCSSPSVGLMVKNLYFRDSGIIVILEYKSEYKDGVITESFQLVSDSDQSKEVTILLHMEVLGKDQGTPSLKEGVKCVERCIDYDSEQSDWKGF